MKPAMKSVRIVVFAKAPQPGFAKTRLIPVLGAQGAADLARRMLEYTLDKALAANVGQVELCVAPSAAEPEWQALALPDALMWSDQGEGDLGEKMARAAQRVLECGKSAGESILLIGTDCPQLSVDHLRQAASALGQADAAFIPTFDGGYALLGLQRFHPSLFANMAWSTDNVAFETLRRLGQLGWTVHGQPMLHDIDEPADLKWLPKTWLEAAQDSICRLS